MGKLTVLRSVEEIVERRNMLVARHKQIDSLFKEGKISGEERFSWRTDMEIKIDELSWMIHLPVGVYEEYTL